VRVGRKQLREAKAASVDDVVASDNVVASDDVIASHQCCRP
jgi:hypothetical protein